MGDKPPSYDSVEKPSAPHGGYADPSGQQYGQGAPPYPQPQQTAGYPPAPPGPQAQYPQQQGPYPYVYQGAPQPPYYAGQSGGTTVIVHQPNVVATRPMFGSTPVQICCGKCGQTNFTNLMFETGGLTWLICGAICLFGGWLGCCLIPFCMDGCKDVVHRCPNCNNYVGRHNRL